MPDLYYWRVRCITDNKYEYVWTSDPDTVPPCPANGAHTVDTAVSSIIDHQDNNEIKIQEETVHTGGNLGVSSKSVDVDASSSSELKCSWEYPISVLAVDVTISTEHVGDSVDVIIGDHTTIGAITSNTAAPTAWVAQNYTAGQTVTYTDPTHGARTYTCILNTVSNEDPTNKTYWQHGYELNVTSDVVTYIMAGYHATLTDGTNTDELDVVVKVDKAANKIYTKNAPTNSFLAATPTYVQQSVYMVKGMKLNAEATHKLGTSKIGGSYIPADTVITVRYHNQSAQAKTFSSWVEFLY